eukprot:1177379-Prorocentrum_minimum.AAC.1
MGQPRDDVTPARRRYGVAHPVVNDGEMTMWRALSVQSWPTLMVVAPTGKVIATLMGEGHRQDIDDIVAAALEFYGETTVRGVPTTGFRCGAERWDDTRPGSATVARRRWRCDETQIERVLCKALVEV